MDSDECLQGFIERQMDTMDNEEEEARLKAERKKKRRALRKALAEQVATESIALKKKASSKSKSVFRGTSVPPRPYKKWSDEKLDKIIADMSTKISIMEDKVQMYNIRLRAYNMEKGCRSDD